MTLFYLPRRLGRSRKAERSGKNNGPLEHTQSSDDTLPNTGYVVTTEAIVLEPFLNGHGSGITVILGEPGAGKTTLSLEWARVLANKTRDPDAVAFWPIHAHCGQVSVAEKLEQIPWVWLERTVPSVPTSLIQHLKNLPKNQTPNIPVVFIFDALDELLETNTKAFISSLGVLPGPVVVTCRTAIWNDRIRQVFRDRKVPAHEVLEIMPLVSTEKLQFLRAWPKSPDPQWASELHLKLQASQQLSQLTGNVLLLELITSVYVEDQGVLPGSRDSFYARAIQQLWRRKRRDLNSASEQDFDDLTIHRDPLLNAIALQQATADRLSTIFSAKTIQQAAKSIRLPDKSRRAVVVELLGAGLLIRSREPLDDNASYTFLHKTFLEYHLTQAWLQGKPKSQWGDVLLKKTLTHWMNSEFDEVLALLISTVDAAGVDLVKTVKRLLEIGVTAPREELFALGRSPLRTVLHLLKRSGVTLSPTMLEFLLENLQSPHRQMAVSVDPNCPVQILEHIARSGKRDVRIWAKGSLREQSNDDVEVFATFSPETLDSDEAVDLDQLHEAIKDNRNDEDFLWGVVGDDGIRPVTLDVLYDVLCEDWDDSKHKVWEFEAEYSSGDNADEEDEEQEFIPDLIVEVIHHPYTFLESLSNYIYIEKKT
jgi:hypothetical protein